eukprot:jgi/Ulvmu1/7114/UM034_0020.1
MKHIGGGSPKANAATATPKYIWMLALACTQVANVVGSLYLKLAMVTPTPPHPVVFALYREVLTGLALLALSSTLYQATPRRRDMLRIAGLGLCLFLNQLLFILGLFLAGVTLASCMQPSIPVFTTVVSMVCGQEQPSSRRLTGAALASAGATAMVYGTSGSAAPPPGPPAGSLDVHATAHRLHLGAHNTHNAVALRAPVYPGGHVAAHVTAHAHTRASGFATAHATAHAGGSAGARQLLADVRDGLGAAAGDVTAGTGVAAAGVGPASGAAGASAPLLGALCLTANCAAMAGYFVIARSISGTYPPLALTAWAYAAAAACMACVAIVSVPWSEFALPACALGPLAYWVVVTSMGGYSILTAATRALPATQVSAFICVQPIAGTLLGWAVLGERVSAWDWGAALIVGGLLLVIQEDRGVVPRMVSMGTPPTGGRGVGPEGSGEFMGLWLPNHPPRTARK